jgi:hypothetical protein
LKLATKGILSLAAITAATSTIALTGVSPANAFAFKITEGSSPDATQFAPAGGATVITFDDLATGAITSANLGGLNLTTTGSTTIGEYDSEDKFLSIGKKTGKKTGSATFQAVVDNIPYLGLYWSEIKGKDKLTLGLSNGQFISYTGAEINAAALPWASKAQDFYLNFYESNVARRFTSLEIVSTGSVVDNVAYRVPTPALLPGLVGMGLAAWRKRKGEEAEQADA